MLIRDCATRNTCGGNVNLIVQYYKTLDVKRQDEIDSCLRNNLLNPILASIHILTESCFDFSSFPNQEKLVQTVIGERMTFEIAIAHANDAFHNNGLWVISNADIYFDESLHYVCETDMSNRFYALTRYEVLPDSTIRLVDADFAHGCQDAWVFRVPVPLERMYTNFLLGTPGCDHRIAYEFAKAGYLVSNPSKKIIARHLDRVRGNDIVARTQGYESLQCDEGYKKGEVVPPPYLRHLYPTENLDKEFFELILLLNQKMEEHASYRHHIEVHLRTLYTATREVKADSFDEMYKSSNNIFVRLWAKIWSRLTGFLRVTK